MIKYDLKEVCTGHRGAQAEVARWLGLTDSMVGGYVRDPVGYWLIVGTVRCRAERKEPHTKHGKINKQSNLDILKGNKVYS